MVGDIKDIRVTKGLARYGRPRHDVPQPALGLFLGHLWLGLLLPFTIMWRWIADEAATILSYRRTARDYIDAVALIGELQKRLEDSESHRFYMQLELEDMMRFNASAPSAGVHEAMDVRSVNMPKDKALRIEVGGFRAYYTIPMMTMFEGDVDGCRHLAEDITRKSTKMFEEWLYDEVCRELSVSEERKGDYYPGGRVPTNMFASMMKHR